MIQDLIEEAFYKCIHETSREGTLILINAITCRKLENEISFSTTLIFGKILTYRGVKIYRSLDIEENEIIVK